MLTPEARHLVKAADLDGLEQLARRGCDEIEISSTFELILEALNRRGKLPPEVVLDWGARYLAWARSFPDRDGLPFFGTTDWARCLLQRATEANEQGLALAVTKAILDSYAPSQKERVWWQRQHYRLAHAL